MLCCVFTVSYTIFLKRHHPPAIHKRVTGNIRFFPHNLSLDNLLSSKHHISKPVLNKEPLFKEKELIGDTGCSQNVNI